MLNTNPNTSQKKNPALAYLSRLGSSRSVITISNCLKHIAVILGSSDIESADWAKFKYVMLALALTGVILLALMEGLR